MNCERKLIGREKIELGRKKTVDEREKIEDEREKRVKMNEYKMRESTVFIRYKFAPNGCAVGVCFYFFQIKLHPTGAHSLGAIYLIQKNMVHLSLKKMIAPQRVRNH